MARYDKIAPGKPRRKAHGPANRTTRMITMKDRLNCLFDLVHLPDPGFQSDADLPATPDLVIPQVAMGLGGRIKIRLRYGHG